MKDLHNNIAVKTAMSPTATTGNAAVTGVTIDRQGFNSVEFVAMLGTITTAGTTYAIEVQESDTTTSGDFTPVADVDLLGTEADIGFVDSEVNTSKKIGYVGIKRYVRVKVTPAGNTGASTFGVTAVLGNPALAPTV